MSAEAKPLPPPVPFLRAAKAVFDLSLEEMVWSRKSLVMAGLLLLPVGLALLFRVVANLKHAPAGIDLYGLVVAMYYLRNALPLASLFFATALIADEVEGRTITYLLSRPVSRASILCGKFAAYVVTGLTLTLPGIVASFFLLVPIRGFAGLAAFVPDLLRDLGVAALALCAYGALFALLGVLLKRPTIPGLVFLIGWESLANLPGWLPRYTVTAWVRSLVRHRPVDEGLAELFQTTLPTGEAIAVLVAITILGLAGAYGIFSRKQFVLDQ
jgi:ABC-type transport system involved in multi-copper enzyme maturation permease subunit